MPKIEFDDPTPPKREQEEPTTLAGFPILAVKGMEDFINLLVYADSGVGKTVLSGSADEVAAMSPVLVIDIEGGAMSLNAFYPGVEVVRIDNWRDLQKLISDLAKGNHKYKTIVLDSLSEAATISMQTILKESAAKAEGRSIDPDVPEIYHWSKNIAQMRRFVRILRDLPVNVIFTALADQEKNNKGKWIQQPSMPGKLKKEIPGLMDIVLYMYIKEVKQGREVEKQRLLLSSSTDTIVAKDRSNMLPQVMEEPTMTKIYEAILGTNPATEATKENK